MKVFAKGSVLASKKSPALTVQDNGREVLVSSGWRHCCSGGRFPPQSFFPPAWNTHLKLLPLERMPSLWISKRRSLQVCFGDDNILISYARVPRLSPGCHILTFSIILRKPCKSTLFCNKNLNFVAYFLCRYMPAPWASLQGINDSSPINQMPKEAPGGGRDVHKSWNGFHNMAFNLVQSVEFKTTPIFQKKIPLLLITEVRPSSD